MTKGGTQMIKGIFWNSLVLATIMIITFSTYVIGQDDPITIRQESMKQVGAASKALGSMVRGRTDYNAETAQQAFTQIRDAVAIFAENFPEGSDSGKTDALPKIWEDMEGFQAASAKFMNEADAAIEPAGESLDSLKSSFEKVAANCKSCHMVYRK